MSRRPPVLFVSILASAMAASTFAVTSVGVLASSLIDEFGITRSQVGGLVTAFSVMAAGLSIHAGRLTDRIGGRNALLAVFVGASAGLALLSTAPGYPMLLLAMAVAGTANSSANPATNHLIADRLEPGSRGVVTGLKMSGVQVGVFVAGVGLPIGLRLVGWRVSLLALAAVPLVGAAILFRLLPSSPGGTSASTRTSLPSQVWVLAVYSFLMSMATNATLTYIPLFAQEAVGFTVAGGGLAVAVAGVVSIPGRIAWGRGEERARRLGLPLLVVSVASVVATVGLPLATGLGGVSLWVSVVAVGLTAGSYNAAATMAIFRSVPPAHTGRASGVVFAGFLGGLGVGPLVFGATVDATGTYTGAWLEVLVVFALCAVIAAVGFDRRPTPA